MTFLIRNITTVLTEFGPMTRSEICEAIGRNKEAIASVVSRMNRPGARTPKRLYIMGYVHDQEGERTYPRAVYALGNKKDAPKPKADQLAVKRRYWARRKTRLTANSVFNLALTRAQIDSPTHPKGNHDRDTRHHGSSH